MHLKEAGSGKKLTDSLGESACSTTWVKERFQCLSCVEGIDVRHFFIPGKKKWMWGKIDVGSVHALKGTLAVPESLWVMLMDGFMTGISMLFNV